MADNTNSENVKGIAGPAQSLGTYAKGKKLKSYKQKTSSLTKMKGK